MLISRAETKNPNAANALLPRLEEPPENVLFLLITSRESQLLSTILSRCQMLRFPPLTIEETTRELMERHGAEESTARASARLAGGSWRAALDWSLGDPRSEIEKAISLLRTLAAGDPGELDVQVEEWSSPGRNRQRELLLELLSSWLRDVMLYDSSPEEARPSVEESVERFARFTRGRPLDLAIAAIENARIDLARNVQPALVLHHLFVRLWRLLFERSTS